MKMNNSITCYADLDREEARARKRIRRQEEALKEKLKSLPEEIVAAGTTKIVAGILNGSVIKTAISIIKSLGSVFTRDKDKESDSKNHLFDIIKNVIKQTMT